MLRDGREDPNSTAMLGQWQGERIGDMAASASLATVRALTFDVQGTCADFCRPLLRMGEAVNRAKGLSVDWGILSADWRGLYRTVLDEIIAGKRPWLRVDRIYRETLDVLLQQHGLSATFTA
eukprot:gene8035-10232_t